MQLIDPTNPVLWQKAKPVTTFRSADLSPMTMDMIVIAEELGGVGLAAPQVGISSRVFVARIAGKWGVYINPSIIRHGNDIEDSIEGCLSFPDRFVSRTRYRVIDVEYQDEIGRFFNRTLKGIDARVFQHELDHLDGICIFDRPTNNN